MASKKNFVSSVFKKSFMIFMIVTSLHASSHEPFPISCGLLRSDIGTDAFVPQNPETAPTARIRQEEAEQRLSDRENEATLNIKNMKTILGLETLEGKTILDIGSSLGFDVQEMTRQGAQAWGLDCADIDLDYAIKRGRISRDKAIFGALKCDDKYCEKDPFARIFNGFFPSIPESLNNTFDMATIFWMCLPEEGCESDLARLLTSKGFLILGFGSELEYDTHKECHEKMTHFNLLKVFYRDQSQETKIEKTRNAVYVLLQKKI